jgi:hypothetical protein
VHMIRQRGRSRRMSGCIRMKRGDSLGADVRS